MSIDWFTFGAQILNFLILVGLLKRFLYGPIVSAMEARNAAIADQMKHAEAARQDANDTKASFEQQLRQFESEKELLLEEARQGVSKWRDEHLERARSDVDVAREEWHQALDQEKTTLFRELQLAATQQSINLGDHLLQSLSDESLQSQVIRKFLAQLDESSVDESTLDALRRTKSIVVATSHDLTDDEANTIRQSLEQLVPTTVNVNFQVDADLACGIEVHTDSCRLAWTIRDSLEKLHSSLVDAVNEIVPESDANRKPTSSDTAPHEVVAS